MRIPLEESVRRLLSDGSSMRRRIIVRVRMP